MEQAILRVRDVMAVTQLSRMTLHRRVRDGSFPAPVRLGPRAIGWRRTDVEQWVEELPEKPAA